jgi:glutamine amidotransferase
VNSSKVTVIDYGMGNLWSVVSAVQHLNVGVNVTSSASEIERAEALILPGVGSFKKAMGIIRELQIDQAILQNIQRTRSKILGICLGMQIFGIESSEDGHSLGLGIIPAKVEEFSSMDMGPLKVPHVGFDQVYWEKDSRLFQGLSQNSDFYFVHSYRMLPNNEVGNSIKCDYGVSFMAAHENQNVFATQFHPEKSQTNGLILLSNFIKC